MKTLILLSALVSIHAFAAEEESTGPAPTCTITAQTEYFISGKDLSSGEPYYTLNDKKLEHACQDVMKEFVKNQANKGSIDSKKATQALQVSMGKAFELVDGYIFYTGCKSHECGNKTLVVFDSKGTNGVLLYVEGKRVRESSSLTPVPANIQSRITSWKHSIQAKMRKYFPGWTLQDGSEGSAK